MNKTLTKKIAAYAKAKEMTVADATEQLIESAFKRRATLARYAAAPTKKKAKKAKKKSKASKKKGAQ